MLALDPGNLFSAKFLRQDIAGNIPGTVKRAMGLELTEQSGE